MLWRRLLVLGVLIDGGAHVVKIFFELSFILSAVLVCASQDE
jgi:hypothetical protein